MFQLEAVLRSQEISMEKLLKCIKISLFEMLRILLRGEEKNKPNLVKSNVISLNVISKGFTRSQQFVRQNKQFRFHFLLILKVSAFQWFRKEIWEPSVVHTNSERWRACSNDKSKLTMVVYSFSLYAIAVGIVLQSQDPVNTIRTRSGFT